MILKFDAQLAQVAIDFQITVAECDVRKLTCSTLIGCFVQLAECATLIGCFVQLADGGAWVRVTAQGELLRALT